MILSQPNRRDILVDCYLFSAAPPMPSVTTTLEQREEKYDLTRGGAEDLVEIKRARKLKRKPTSRLLVVHSAQRNVRHAQANWKISAIASMELCQSNLTAEH